MSNTANERAQQHWEQVYTRKPASAVSWYQVHAERSLRLIADTRITLQTPIIDVGGGASTLVDDLLARGHCKISVLDISAEALHAAQVRLGARAAAVDWIVGDITTVQLPLAHYGLWHDRAVFHFLTDAQARAAYKAKLAASLEPDGYLVIATFAEDGPTQCSGLPVRRYSAAELEAEFGSEFTLLKSEAEAHTTPAGTEQRFIYCCFCRTA